MGTQGINRYGYVGNNPLNRVDPSGFSKADEKRYKRWDNSGYPQPYVYSQNCLHNPACLEDSAGRPQGAGATPIGPAVEPSLPTDTAPAVPRPEH